MKTMFLVDYATSKRLVLQQTLLAIGICLFVVAVIGNAYMLIPMIGVIIPIYSLITLVTFDERNGWENYRLMLPLSRTNVVMGRYLFFAALAVFSVLVGVLLYTLLMLLAPVLGLLPLERELIAQLGSFDFEAMLVTVFAPLFITVGLVSVVCPLAFRFGMTKAVRWVPFVFVAAVFAVGGVLQYADPNMVADVFAWFSTPGAITTFLLIAAVVACVIYVASALLSARLYKTREL